MVFRDSPRLFPVNRDISIQFEHVLFKFIFIFIVNEAILHSLNRFDQRFPHTRLLLRKNINIFLVSIKLHKKLIKMMFF